MNFENNHNPFIDIYKQMLNRVYEQYLYHSGRKEYQVLQNSTQEEKEATSSIDDILTQDSNAVLDKVKNTALSIAYRIKIHADINYQSNYNWFIVKNQLVSFDDFYPSRDHGSERRRSMLTSDLIKIYNDRLDEKLQCWKDLKDEMKYFIHLFHQYRQLKSDQKLLE